MAGVRGTVVAAAVLCYGMLLCAHPVQAMTVASMMQQSALTGTVPSPSLRGLMMGPPTLMPPAQTLAANVSTAIENAVTQLFATQRAKDCTSFVALFADTFSLQDPYGSTPVTNTSVLMANCEASNKLFKTVTVVPEAIYSAGYGAGVIWTVKSITASGCQLDFTGIDSVLFDSSIKITQLQGYFDTATAASQMNCTSA